MNDWINIQALEIVQPIGSFYAGVIDFKDLTNICFSDPRVSSGDTSTYNYFGIQRALSPRREKELQSYVNTVDAAFPNSVIIAVNVQDINYDEDNHIIQLKKQSGVAKLIDGQHRIAGLSNFQGEKFDVLVSIFVDMDEQDQAIMFATINLKQEKVDKSLAYDLFELTETRSPQKTCHDIAKLLNFQKESALYNRIKVLGRLGTASTKKFTTTQSSFVESLKGYISKDDMIDRDYIKRGKRIPYDKSHVHDLIFRKLFIDERDSDIAYIIYNYFNAVQHKWPEAWENEAKENILNKGIGFRALMMFLKKAYQQVGNEVPTLQDFESVFSTINLESNFFSKPEFRQGGSAAKRVYDELCKSASYKLD